MKITKHLNHGGKTNNPTLIILHSMGEYIESDPEDLHAADFLDKIGLSAHALVCPDGNVIRLREDYESAFHAKGFNENSLGIEFLVEGIHTYASFVEKIKTPYLTSKQFDAGVDQVRDWVERHNIESIKAHSEISPGRKVDPGFGFPQTEFIQAVFS